MVWIGYVLTFSITLFLALAYRVLFVYLHRSYFKQGFVGDSSVHFTIINQLKKDRKSRFIDQYVMTQGPMTYPLGFHRFSMIFPLSIIREYSYIPNLIVFSLFSALYFTYLHYLELELLKRDDYLLVILAAIVFFISVSNTVFYGPAITYIKLSERLLARVSCALYYLSLSVYLLWGDVFSVFLAVVSGSIALTSSVFARQVMMFTAPLLALLFLSLNPILILLGSFVLALVISKGYLLRSIKHSTFLYWSIYRILNKQSGIVNRALSRFISVEYIGGRIRQKAFKTLLHELVFLREPTRTLVFYPGLALFALFLFLADDEQLIRLAVPVVAVMIVYVLTSTERFNHLGESYRYIEYGLYFYLPMTISLIAISLSKFVDTSPLFALYIAYVGLVLGAAFYADRLLGYPQSDHLTTFLSHISLTKDSVVYPITMRLGADICARVDCQSFWWQPGGITDPELYQEFIQEYPYLKRDWSPLFEKHGVTHVICDKSALKQITWRYDLSGLELLHEDENYIAYTVAEEGI